jgi:hypothetical protein
MHKSCFRLLTIGALVVGALISGEARAAAITHYLTIEVHQLCDDAGQNCASLGPEGNPYFGSQTRAIWSQAGIAVFFNFAGQIHSTAFSDLDDGSSGHGFLDLQASYGSMGPSMTTVDMFLVHTLPFGLFGVSSIGMGGMAIGMDAVMAYNGGMGRIDTISHELGHNFGLVPIQLGGDAGSHSSLADFLMAFGEIRTVPTNIGDIAPNGLGLDLIPENQAEYALQSSLLTAVPEPESFGFVAVGLGMLVGRARRVHSTIKAQGTA